MVCGVFCCVCAMSLVNRDNEYMIRDFMHFQILLLYNLILNVCCFFGFLLLLLFFGVFFYKSLFSQGRTLMLVLGGTLRFINTCFRRGAVFNIT